MPIPVEQAAAAVRHLRCADVRLRQVIDAVGPFSLKLHRNRFRTLVRAIVSQQLSTAAAKTINLRLEQLVGTRGMTADVFARLSDEQYRTCGVSRQKIGYLRDLVERVQCDEVRLDRLGRLDDEAVIAELVRIKGIGRWTAQMFLIFTLGRVDVLAEDDLGLRAAVKRLHGLEELPSKQEFRDFSAPWRPYATVASWYCWRSSDLKLLKS
jgi:DNA-3-methyladenine glycosylase II